MKQFLFFTCVLIAIVGISVGCASNWAGHTNIHNFRGGSAGHHGHGGQGLAHSQPNIPGMPHVRPHAGASHLHRGGFRHGLGGIPTGHGGHAHIRGRPHHIG